MTLQAKQGNQDFIMRPMGIHGDFRVRELVLPLMLEQSALYTEE